jgi:signal transduction histidine kinase/DNA-binding response OmpR family regulator
MALRLNSLKTRTALAVTLVIVITLALNAVYLIVTKQAEMRAQIESEARTFAQLTKAPICVGYDGFYRSGFYKFRELVRDAMTLNRDVERIQIIDVNGQVLFDSGDAEEPVPPVGPDRLVKEPQRLEAVKRLEPSVLRGRDAAGEETLEIVAPHLEDWGRHRLSVSYLVSYKNLRPSIVKLLTTTLALTLISMLASVGVAVMMARRITRPLEELTRGAQHIADGHFDRRLAIRSGDEIQVLAEAFNHMSARLKQNVEQLEESNKKLAGVNEELKELDRVKSDLLANVSHELRTPLTAIKGYTDYMLERKLGAISDKQEKGLLVVQRNMERLARTINALLDFSRLDLGRVTLNIHPFQLPALIDHILLNLRSELEKKGLSLAVSVDAALPPVIGDREKISAVLENLIINAVKFTPEGGRLTVSAGRLAGATRPTAELRVADTGIGIPADQVERIFQRFHQVDASSTRRFGGVGLGLAIVKSILEAHGSPIDVASEVGRGTEFRFTLPLLEKHDAVRDPRPRHDDEHLAVIVDDDEDFLRAVRWQMEEEGWAVLGAGTAADGAVLVAERHPEVVILDLLLPDRSGLDLLAMLRADPATRQVPVIVVSVVSDPVRSLSLGASEHLAKPVDASAVAAAARRVVAAGDGRGPTVLVAGADGGAADGLRVALRREGFRTLLARDGRQALDVLGRRRPDAVVMDMGLPELGGLQVLEEMARDELMTRVPVLLLAGEGGETEQRRAMALGARRCLGIPVDPHEVAAEVRRQVALPAELPRPRMTV